MGVCRCAHLQLLDTASLVARPGRPAYDILVRSIEVATTSVAPGTVVIPGPAVGAAPAAVAAAQLQQRIPLYTNAVS